MAPKRPGQQVQPLSDPEPEPTVPTNDVTPSEEAVSNADILKAVKGLADSFDRFELLVNKNTSDIAEMNDKVTGLEMKWAGTD